jgi:protein-S-isoprenylcysteine O-methyltransferase Ste14
MDTVSLICLIVCWIVWAAPFLAYKARTPQRKADVTVESSRWGVALQMMGYFLAWRPGPEPRPPAMLVAGVLVGCLAVLVSWTSIRALGKQLRVHAGLYRDHELVRSGPYSIVRHPIYAGMLAMYLATALIRPAWPVGLIGLAIFIVGTEIRVRIEDGLLASRFGQQFAEYKASVPAYIPFVR